MRTAARPHHVYLVRLFPSPCQPCTSLQPCLPCQCHQLVWDTAKSGRVWSWLQFISQLENRGKFPPFSWVCISMYSTGAGVLPPKLLVEMQVVNQRPLQEASRHCLEVAISIFFFFFYQWGTDSSELMTYGLAGGHITNTLSGPKSPCQVVGCLLPSSRFPAPPY